MISFALVAVGHFAFLTLAYIGSRFSEWEVRTAASFFRYMSQLQMAAMMIVLLKLTDIICIHFRHTYPALRIGGTLLVIAIPVAGLVITGFDLFEKPNPSIQHTRDYAKAIFPHMPAHGKVGMIGTTTNGLENTMIRFQWCLMASMKHEPELTGYATQYTGEKTVDDIKRFAERYDAVMVAPHDDLAMKALGEPLNENWVSFIKNGNRWTKIQEKDK